jgi:hypothetical protein
VRDITIDFTDMGGDVVQMQPSASVVCSIRPFCIFGSDIDGIAVLIDAIVMVSGREKFIVVAVMTARMTRDAI